MSRGKVSRLPRATRVADIMRAAQDVFCEKGFPAASTADIASRAGIVEGTLYRYFSSKRDLLVKVVEDFYERIFAGYDRQLEGVQGTWSKLRFLIWKHLNVIHGNPAMCRLILQELRVWPEYRSSGVYELNRRYTQKALAVIEEAIERGEFHAHIPFRIVRDMIFGCAEHHAWAFLRGEGDFSPDVVADAITDLIYQGLAVNPRPEIANVDESIRRLEQVAARLEKSTAPSRRKPRGGSR